MTRVSIAFDEQAEEDLAGLAAVGRNPAAVVLARVAATDCYLPAVARILAHALDADVLAAEDTAAEDKLEARLNALSVAADVDLVYLRSLASVAPYGRIYIAPRMVAEAARRRELMALAAEVYNGAATLSIDELSDLVARMSSALPGGDVLDELGGVHLDEVAA